MEIILVLLACAAVGAYWYFNRTKTDHNYSVTHEAAKDLNVPPERDAYSPPEIKVEAHSPPAASADPPKKTRKPRTAKTDAKPAAKKPATKTPAAKKPAATKRSKKA